jgi:glutamine synthetase
MHDQTYFKELKISNAENGYHDIIAIPDLSSFRRIPWEDNVPFFLVSFYDPDTQKPISACPRGLLKTALEKLEAKGFGAMAGGELVPTSIFPPSANQGKQQRNMSSSNSKRLQPNLLQIYPKGIIHRRLLSFEKILSMPYHRLQRACSVTA